MIHVNQTGPQVTSVPAVNNQAGVLTLTEYDSVTETVYETVYQTQYTKRDTGESESFTISLLNTPPPLEDLWNPNQHLLLEMELHLSTTDDLAGATEAIHLVDQVKTSLGDNTTTGLALLGLLHALLQHHLRVQPTLDIS